MRVQPARPKSPLTTTLMASAGEASAACRAAQRPAPPAPRTRMSASTTSITAPGAPRAGRGPRAPSSLAPPTGAAPSRTRTSVLTAARPSMARMVLRALMPDAGGVQRLADIEGREEELELGVFDGVGGQHVGPERRHAPLESLAHVP